MFNSVVVRGQAAQGYSTGEAMKKMEEIVDTHLPKNIEVEWSGLSYQEKQAGGKMAVVLALVFVFVFLFLAALYESWIVPIAVLLSLPVAALGSYLGVWVCGLENDIYFQIGLVMLMGLAAKNAILIVEFAKELRAAGMELWDATVKACQLRFRPIIMTSMAFLLGVLPLAISTGAGSASHNSIGTGIVGGTVVATLLGVLFVPVFFYYLMYFVEKVKGLGSKD
jgi:multidrug efflux pump subunit AcrB